MERGRCEHVHATSIFTNSCLATPRCPNTSFPSNGLKSSNIPVEWDAERLQWGQPASQPALCGLHIQGTSPKKPATEQRAHHAEQDNSQHQQRLKESQLLLSQVSQLSDDHQRTQAMLEALHRNQQQLKQLTMSLVKDIHLQTDMHLGESLVDEEPLSSSEATTGDGGSIANSGSLSSLSSTSHENSENAPLDFHSTGINTVDHMWDEFSLDAYASSLEDEDCDATNLNGAAAAKVWYPRITIPEPFAMSVREENKIRKKSKSAMIAERECIEREARIEAEMRQQFRASPLPATTFLPLYDMLNAKQEQRRRQLRALSKQILKLSERPFSFQQREAERRKMKARRQELLRELEMQELKERRNFKATPVPKHVLDSMVDEQMREREEYRKIRTRVRAMETLASSHLPLRMQADARKYGTNSLGKSLERSVQTRELLDEKHMFQPSVNNRVPDHDLAYQNFQAQLQAKRRECVTTVAKPFKLRTAQREQQKRNGGNGVHIHISDASPPQPASPITTGQTPPALSGSASTKPSRQQQYSAGTTRSFHLHQQATEIMLLNRAEEEEMKERKKEQQRLREKQVQRTVMERSIGNDLTGWLEDKRRKRIQELR